MNKLIAFLVFFILLLPCRTEAGVRPDVKVNRIKPVIRYETSLPVTSCGPDAVGCTSAGLQYSVSVDCQRKQIVLSFGYSQITVQIVNQYKKGSIDFDATLKHELTHVALREEITEKFYRPTASACLMQYERSAARTNSCEEIEANVKTIFFKYMKRLEQEVEKHDRLIDGDENYAYQSMQIFNKKMGQDGKKYRISQPHRKTGKNVRSKEENRRFSSMAKASSNKKRLSSKNNRMPEEELTQEETELTLVMPRPQQMPSLSFNVEKASLPLPSNNVKDTVSEIGKSGLSGLFSGHSLLNSETPIRQSNDLQKTVLPAQAQENMQSAQTRSKQNDFKAASATPQSVENQGNEAAAGKKPKKQHPQMGAAEHLALDTFKTFFEITVEEFKLKEKWISFLKALLGSGEKMLSGGTRNQSMSSKEAQESK
ncbi:MAG: hypothetical protein IJ752_05740 [Alphaproteobacteria bacterium]|nr:hypothetical protein [Alphaproteobacteria bacterium]